MVGLMMMTRTDLMVLSWLSIGSNNNNNNNRTNRTNVTGCDVVFSHDTRIVRSTCAKGETPDSALNICIYIYIYM